MEEEDDENIKRNYQFQNLHIDKVVEAILSDELVIHRLTSTEVALTCHHLTKFYS